MNHIWNKVAFLIGFYFLYIGGIGIIRADKNEMTDKIIKVNIDF